MVKIVFMCLCGCLYVIGLPFGWDYRETSVYICIYACPIICMLCAFISLFSCNIRTFWGRCRTSLNASLLLLYANTADMFWTHYGEVADPFTLCMNDIIEIARELHISYELCNLYIYCVLFGAIILFHLGQFIVFKYKKRNLLRSNSLFGLLCNGNTIDFDSIIYGSNPYNPTTLCCYLRYFYKYMRKTF